jgi:hypothetical protein
VRTRVSKFTFSFNFSLLFEKVQSTLFFFEGGSP